MLNQKHRIVWLFMTLCLLFLGLPQAASSRALPTEAASQIAATVWSNFQYVFVAGSTFTPRASATTWGYPGAGCVHVAAGGDLFTLPLNLPQGSRIDYLRLYYYDTSANNSTAWITVYDGAGATVDLISVGSTGNVGYGTTLSAYSGHLVNNASNSYVLNWRANQTGTTMRLCGMRVAYRVPLQLVFLPLAIKGG